MPFDFKCSWRVRFDEIDLQGVVHHPQIVKYLEIARIEFYRHLGISYKIMREEGYEFIVRKVNVRYRKPLYFDEIIDVHVGIAKLANASFIMGYEIYNHSGALAVTAEIELLCSEVTVGKPTALPQKYHAALKSALSD